jgi:hypothetical protein
VRFSHSKIKVATRYKKSKGKALSENEKNEKIENPELNPWGVKIEHVLAHLKRFRILKDKLKLMNYKPRFNDLVMPLAFNCITSKGSFSKFFFLF